MKILVKLIAAAALAGLAPAVALSQAAPAPAAVQSAPATGGAGPSATAPGGAQPEDVSGANVVADRPSDAQVAQSSAASQAAPEPGIGQPGDGGWQLQEQFTPIGQEAAWFHDWILMPAITIISLFVLILLLWVIVRYRRSANPTPTRTTHNTLLEVVWTLVPVIILVLIAVPSIRLLANQYDPPRADLTIKVIGNQWYWEYEYPDHNVSFVSNILTDEDAQRRGEPRLLAVDNRLVVPQGATVKLIITSNDVVHSWGIPAFWTKIDAVPGRLNETWFRTDRPGLYYGQCFELCGARHAYMPIAVEVVTPAQFAAWVGTRGGQMPGSRPAAAPAAPTGAAPTGAAPTGGAPATTPPTTPGATTNSQGGSQ